MKKGFKKTISEVLGWFLFIAYLVIGFRIYFVRTADIKWYPFVCETESGLIKGKGRYSVNNEYSQYLDKKMKQNEYVVFRYENEKKEYVFLANKCQKIQD